MSPSVEIWRAAFLYHVDTALLWETDVNTSSDLQNTYCYKTQLRSSTTKWSTTACSGSVSGHVCYITATPARLKKREVHFSKQWFHVNSHLNHKSHKQERVSLYSVIVLEDKALIHITWAWPITSFWLFHRRHRPGAFWERQPQNAPLHSTIAIPLRFVNLLNKRQECLEQSREPPRWRSGVGAILKLPLPCHRI